MRGAAGRRVVQVVLLVGGLFVLGVLCGERASAAEGVPTSPLASITSEVQEITASAASVEHASDGAPDTSRDTTPDPVPRPTAAVSDTVTDATGPVARVVQPVGEHVVEPVTRHVVEPTAEQVVRPVSEDLVRPVTDDVVRPVTEGLVRPVTEGLVRPVTEGLVRPVTEGLVQPVAEGVVRPIGDVVESVTEGLVGAPSQFPPVTELPSPPGLPQWPDLPGLPVWPVLPGETLPADVTPQVPGGAESERPGAIVDGGRERAVVPEPVVHGPHVGADSGAVAVPVAHRAAGTGDARVARTPVQQGPDGLPTGALRGRSAVDNGGPRHAEPHAVTSLHQAPLSLVPGATAADAAYGTRDHHRDIPEFPG